MKDSLKNKKVLYVYTGDHPVHKEFAKQVTLHFSKLSTKLPKGYDIYLIEGSYVLPVVLRKMGRINPNAKMIVLFADPRLYYLKKRIRFSYKKRKLYRMNFLRQKISKMALRNIDGAICEGDVNFELFKEFCPGKPVKKIIPFIWDTRFEELVKVKPHLESKNILFVGNGPDEYCKGLGLLIEVFKEIYKTDSSYRLDILGENWDIKKEWVSEGVFFRGRSNTVPFLKKSSLLVHLGQGEGFGIQILESLLAGVPTIVSEGTGARDIVKKVGREFVVQLDKKKIIARIQDYFHSSNGYKKKISGEGRKILKDLPRKKVVKNFEKEFYEIMGEIYGKN